MDMQTEGVEFLEDNFEEESENEDDDNRHSKLLSAIANIGKEKSKSKKNIIPVKTATEHVVSSNAKAVTVGNLLKTLTDKALHANIKKAVSKDTKHFKTLPAPLERPQSEKIIRVAAYDKAKNEVGKWDPVVYQNRLGTAVQEFPLYQPDSRLIDGNAFAKKFKPKTPLEEQITALLHGSKNVMKNGEELTEAEKLALSSMSLKEALERRRELGRIRALQAHQEAKARRQNKIKSKKYHRLLKREKLKKQLKEFEELQKTNPGAALEKLQEMELQRIEERANLRHKNSGKWAKTQAIRSKYNTEAKQALSEQLEIGRRLKEKVKESDFSSEEEEEAPILFAAGSKFRESKNPWLVQAKPTIALEIEEGEDTPNYRKFWAKVNAEREKAKATEDTEKVSLSDDEAPMKDEIERDESSSSEKEEEFVEAQAEAKFGDADVIRPLRGDGKYVRIRSNEELDEQAGQKESLIKESRIPKTLSKSLEQPHDQKTGPVEIDPSKFIVIESKKIKSSVNITLEDGEDEEEIGMGDQRMTIAEAFADDDVIAEFSEEKKDALSSSKSKNIDLFLPGWGNWGGKGIKINQRKRKRYMIKAPPAPPRKDHNTGNLIINEEKNDSVRSHQVNKHFFFFFLVVSVYVSCLSFKLYRIMSMSNSRYLINS
ncbi:hypothetical protein QYM36_019381 [Artemia franciscana]|uniref:U3 small nucleolar RNA-associated protein 14 homolog A n=1 Tax=Artemia franciscana TaxID=6661 RepID=A0AA88H7Z1_ARTSF|nr:hypothetical protein QYM36_019381 [Artemia franciscana]